MKKMNYFFIVALLLCAFKSQAMKVNTDLLESYAKHAQFLDVKISPTGDYLASTSRDDEGVISLTVLDTQKQKIVSITRGKGKESVSSFDWLNDERLLLTMAREVGSLEQPLATGELISMNADGSNMVILTGYRAESNDKRFSSIVHNLPEESDQVLIFSVARGAEEPFIDLYRMKVTTGRKKGLGRIPLRNYKNTGVNVYSTNTGEVLAAQGIDPNENNKITLIARESEDDEWKTILESYEYEGTFTPVKLLDDRRTLIGISSLETDTNSIATLDIISKEHKVLLKHDKSDLSPIFNMKNGVAGELLGAAFEYEALSAMFIKDVQDKASQSIIKGLLGAFPNQSVGITSATKDNKSLVVRVSSANNPSVFYLFDNKNRKLSVLTPSKPWLKKDTIPTTEIIKYKSRDGLEITGLLTLPISKSKNLPLIMLPHGGPHGVRDTLMALNSDVKVLASHGYAVFQPNYRGSGGYGLEFLTSGFRRWGTDMINDMTDGVQALIDSGIASKDKVCVYGASYGGYAALQSVIREPNLYQCSIGFVGVYDLDMMLVEGDIPESQSGINYLNTVLPQGKNREFQSPVKNVEKIKVPLYIVQGEDDRRVPKEQAFALRSALDKHNKDYKWLMKDGEGHGFYNPKNKVELWTEMLKFFNQHIGE